MLPLPDSLNLVVNQDKFVFSHAFEHLAYSCGILIHPFKYPFSVDILTEASYQSQERSERAFCLHGACEDLGDILNGR